MGRLIDMREGTCSFAIQTNILLNVKTINAEFC